MTQEIKKPFYASASSIKLFQSCSLKYFYSRLLKIPEDTNSGALMGTAAHTILECLLKPRHKDKFDNILANKSIEKCEVVKRYITKYIKYNNLNEESFNKISGFIATGISFDFFQKEGEIVGAEIPFEIGSEEEGYFIRGFIDRLTIYKQKWAAIWDWKSSKKKFEGKDYEENLQALIYSLAVKKLYPELNLKSVVSFWFLAFPDDPEQRFPPKGPVTDDMLIDLEFQLRGIWREMASFSAADRWKNIASKQGYPAPDAGFSGALVCGYSKYPGHLKKTGEPYFACAMKWPFKYYALVDADGKEIRTAVNKNDLKLKDGMKIEEKHFGGCEYFNKGSRY